MVRKVLRSKIHGATITHADLHYEGSITLSPELMRQAGIVEYEALHVWDVTNGARLETYAICGLPGSNDICMNGAAAHLIHPGDKVIIASFEFLESDSLNEHKPKILFMDERNCIKELRSEVAGPQGSI